MFSLWTVLLKWVTFFCTKSYPSPFPLLLTKEQGKCYPPLRLPVSCQVCQCNKGPAVSRSSIWCSSQKAMHVQQPNAHQLPAGACSWGGRKHLVHHFIMQNSANHEQLLLEFLPNMHLFHAVQEEGWPASIRLVCSWISKRAFCLLPVRPITLIFIDCSSHWFSQPERGGNQCIWFV